LRIDLHIHSTASDGSLAPAAVVAAARAGGLDVIALADHDTIGGVAEAQIAAAGFVHVIPAIELSTHHDSGELHMLGYYIDPSNQTLVRFSARAGNRRQERMRDMIERLERIGVHVAYEDVLAAAGPRADSIGRPHLARALLQRGYVTTIGEAFDRFIGDDGPAFEATRLLTPAEAIELIHQSQGVAVWAHPRPDLLDIELPRLAAWGLDGIECYRPRVNAVDAGRMLRAAERYSLFVTGGSDWHGDWHGPLGEFSIERDDVSAFLEIGGI
jgi:3',5'-nucleoside bisphosphate phosphatase